MWNNLLSSINSGLSKYKNSLLSASVKTWNTTNNNLNSCQQANSKNIKYKYEWIYVVEDWKSYKLFDYIDNLTWKEKVVWIDYDNDGDKDLLYLVDNELFVKENLSVKDNKNYSKLYPLEVDSDDNKFVNWDYFIEAVNWFEETAISSNIINFKFLASTNPDINNYRVEFYDRVDKNLRLWEINYSPDNLKKTVIDSISDKDNIWLFEEKNWYKKYKNIAYFDYIWTVPWVTLVTHRIATINDSIRNGNLASITANKKLYTWNSDVTIYYIENNDKKEIQLEKYSNITFSQSVKIYKITGWELYTDTGFKEIIKWQNISKYLHKPIFFDTEIRVDDDRALTTASHIDLKYYDGSSLGLDLRKIDSYRIYDLWFKSDNYLVTLSKKNDYYYARIYAFNNWVRWTKSNQILLSPQLAADNFAPDLNFNSTIKIPVYQTRTIDFSDYIFENWWIDNITEIKIDRLNPPNYKILRSPWKIKIKFGKFDRLFKTKIKISLKDKNGNLTTKDVGFEVYSPTPYINNYNDAKITGILNEKLSNEPINIYRVRWWIITKLETTNNNTKVNTNSWWEYSFDVKTQDDKFSQKIYLKDDISRILDINWSTWKITLKNIWYSIIVENNNIYPEIYVVNKTWEKIYREKLVLDEFNEIKLIWDFSKIWEENGLYLKMISDKYWYYINSLNIDYNPWVLVIYRKTDTNKTPLFIVFRDWRIKSLNANYKLEYSTYNDYVVYKMIDKHFNRVVAELLLKVSNNFIIK
jgi:hypothetical protein